MPRFIYKAGFEFNRGDDTEPSAKLPADTTAFGIEFLRGQPTEVRPDMFDDPAKYEHAVRKLRGNHHFEEVGEAEEPAKKRGKAAPPADEPAE